MSNKVYDILKLIALTIIPFTAMIAAIIVAFRTSQADAIVIAIGEAIHGFLGTFLTVSSKIYAQKINVQLEEDEVNG